MHPLDEVVASLKSAPLEDAVGDAALLRRHDHKFVISLEQATAVAKNLNSDWRVLEVDGRRAHRYRSRYFDTLDFTLFRSHVQGRRRRYKVRVRSQGESTNTWLELKTKTDRSETNKLRWLRDGDGFADLTVIERSHLATALDAVYGSLVLPPLVASLDLRYVRRTLINSLTNERITMDVDLIAETAGATGDLFPDAVVMEIKSSIENGPSLIDVRKIGLRPMRASKYCVAVSSLVPGASPMPLRDALRGYQVLRGKPLVA